MLYRFDYFSMSCVSINILFFSDKLWHIPDEPDLALVLSRYFIGWVSSTSSAEGEYRNSAPNIQ